MRLMMNILILSCGTRNKIVQAFKKELGDAGKVFATDCSELAPALYDADDYFIVPREDAEGYLEVILSICKENKVAAVLSLIDPELSLLAENRKRFLEIGTLPIVSGYEEVEMCFDKYRMFRFLKENGFRTVQSYRDRANFQAAVETGQATYPVFVKPVKGSASININKVSSEAELDLMLNRHEGMLIQEFMDGTEYGADVYIDMISGEVVSIFIKEKIKMRAGETDKSVSVKDDALFAMIKQMAEKAGFRGIIDIDIFQVAGQYYISEVNPRFGGGYPHAYACGINVPKMIFNNISGTINEAAIGDYKENIYMMKYNEVKIMDRN